VQGGSGDGWLKARRTGAEPRGTPERERVVANAGRTRCLAGFLPRRTAPVVEEWPPLHIGELQRNGKLAQQSRPHEPISPLE